MSDFLTAGRGTVAAAIGGVFLGASVLLAQVSVKAGDISAKAGTELKIPISVGDLSGKAITSYEFIVICDTSIFRLDGIEQDGTLSAGLLMYANNRVQPFNRGRMKVVCASTKPLKGNGILVYLRGTTGSKLGTSQLQLQSVLFNTGNPEARAARGSVRVVRALAGAPPAPRVRHKADSVRTRK